MSRRVSVADRLDAAGIGQHIGDSTHVSSAVEHLIAPTVVAGADTIVHVPVKLVEPHPHNRKIRDEDVADIVAGLKAGEPILNPLGVTAAADWNATKPEGLAQIGPLCFIITAGGHRRLRAAELAGLETVPCIVRADFAGAKGRKAALLENLQRQDLDAFEEAEAFAELIAAPYKLSQREIAAVVGCNQSHVSKRLKMLALPSTVRESVRVGKTPIPDAIELARVADQGPIFDAAWERYTRSSWSTGKEAVDTAIAAHEQRVLTEKAAALLADQGVRRLDRHPTSYAYSKKEPASLEALKLDPAKHTTEPCHAGYITTAGEIVLACEKPGNHVKGGSSKLAVRKSIEQQMGSSHGDQEAKQRAERRELKKLFAGRAVIARELVYGRDDLTESAEAELVARGSAGLAFHGAGRAEIWRAVRDFVSPLELGSYPTTEETDALLAKLPAAVVQRALALAYFESRIRTTWMTWGSEGRYYLDLLASRGYTITALEKRKLGKAKTPGSPDADDDQVDDGEVRSCAKCGCTDDEACDGGCAWVAENLCSACSDAVDGGFLDDHEQLLAASEAVG